MRWEFGDNDEMDTRGWTELPSLHSSFSPLSSVWTTCILWTNRRGPSCCFGALALAGQPAVWPGPHLWRFPHQQELGTDSSTLPKRVSCSWELTHRWLLWECLDGMMGTNKLAQVLRWAGQKETLHLLEWTQSGTGCGQVPFIVLSLFWTTYLSGDCLELLFLTNSLSFQSHCVKASCHVVSTIWNRFLMRTPTQCKWAGADSSQVKPGADCSPPWLEQLERPWDGGTN